MLHGQSLDCFDIVQWSKFHSDELNRIKRIFIIFVQTVIWYVDKGNCWVELLGWEHLIDAGHIIPYIHL